MELNAVYGIHAIEKLLKNKPKAIQQLFIVESEKSHRIQELLKLAKANNISPEKVSKKKIEQLSQTTKHQNIYASITENKPGHEHDLMDHIETTGDGFYIALDSVEDPRNVGAIIRSAEAMGAKGIILPKDKSASITATVRKVACGAAELLPIFQVTNLVREIKAMQLAGYWVYGSLLNEKSQSLFKTTFAPKSIVVLGSEGKGIRQLTQKHCDEFVSIPMSGITESLNVSVAAGIFCAELLRQKDLMYAQTKT